MSSRTPESKQPSAFQFSPAALIRLSSVLIVMLTVGHTSAYPWASNHGQQEIELVSSMKTVGFVFLGERSTYWNLYFGWGLLVSVLLLTLALVLWFLSDLVQFAPRPVGVIAGVISAACLIGALLSSRFFYLPPTITFAVVCLILLATAARLLRRQTGLEPLRPGAPV